MLVGSVDADFSNPHHRWLLGTVIFLMPLIPVGCPGSGATTQMPLTISPAGFVGIPDDEVQFAAHIDELSPSATYAWDFGDGATPSTSTDTSPTVTLGDPGTYEVSLEITDGATTHNASAEYSVAGVPVIQSVSPTGEAGLPVATVQFSAGLAWPNATGWQWSFELGDAEPVAFEVAEPELSLPNPGRYQGTVIASNPLGDSEVFAFEFTVGTPVAPTWTVQELGPVLGSDPAQYNRPHSIVTGLVYEGKVVLAYTAPGGLTIRRALVALPEGPGDWEEYLLDAEGFVAGVHTMTVHKGKLALLYQRRSGTPDDYPAAGTRMCLAQATTSVPICMEDWSIHEIEPGSAGIVFSSLASINDDYLLAITRRFGIRVLVSNEEPESEEDWVIYNIPEDSARFLGEYPGRIVQRGGTIFSASSYGVGWEGGGGGNYSVDLLRTVASPPLTAGDWNLIRVAANTGQKSPVDLWPHGNGWAVAAGVNPASDRRINIFYTSTLELPAYELWPKLTIEGPTPACFAPSVEVVGGRAVVAYFDNTNMELRVARQRTTDIDQTSDWERSEVIAVDGSHREFWVAPLILELDGRIAIFWCEPESRRLRYALADTIY